ncbi:MAG: malto-oligosyltrehalose trehalohydrolase, partial [Myxococcales bacterium]
MGNRPKPQGAFVGADGTTFRVWAPNTDRLELLVEGRPPVALSRDADGLFEAHVPGVRAGDRYVYRFPDGRQRPDPASRLQEESVHAQSTVVDPAFDWTDRDWKGVPLEDLILYELHIGTFTREGTLDAIHRHLPELKKLGVTAIELLPVAAFDGPRGWGYDGVQPYAVHAPYGGPAALRRFVDACHRHGLGVYMDVVYNHMGPAGNYLRDFGPYFTDRHSTPWGEAINYDAEGSRHVRAWVVENALMWIRDFHCDGLRLDAVHGIYDDSPTHLLKELNDEVQALAKGLGREVHVIAESDLNEPKLIERVENGGYGLSSQWTDDFHHSLHTLLTGERSGYYADYGGLKDLARVFREAFVYAGQYSEFRKRHHGRSARGLPGRRFTVAAQNHDQVGNRATGDRLTASLPPEALRFAAAATVLSPFV